VADDNEDSVADDAGVDAGSSNNATQGRKEASIGSTMPRPRAPGEMTSGRRSGRVVDMTKNSKGTTDPGTAVEQRRAPRIPLDILIQVRASSIEEFRQVHCANISTTGMFLKTSERRPLGAEFFFQFTVAGGGTLIEGLGKVVRIAEDGMGIEFVSLLEPSASIVTKLVEDRLATTA
jgi:hypothetical protein